MIDIKKYWEQLSDRDKKFGLLGGFILSVMLIYFLIINPLANKVKALKASIIDSQQLIAWMEEASEQVKQVQNNVDNKGSQKISLLSLIENSSKASKLGSSVSEIKQIDENKVQLKFKTVVFDHLIEWLNELQLKHRVYVKKITLRRTESSGIVQADAVLAR